jgi:hypothetical protein
MFSRSRTRNILNTLFLISLGLSSTPAAERKTPTPTPSTTAPPGERHISEYADRVELDRSLLDDTNGAVEITNDTVRKLEEHGLLTTASPIGGTAAGAARTTSPAPVQVDPKRRTYWRARVLSQAKLVDKCTGEIARLDAKIDSLEDAAFDSGTRGAKQWARVDETKRLRAIAETRCRRERAALSNIVREARKEGAQPGWFR